MRAFRSQKHRNTVYRKLWTLDQAALCYRIKTIRQTFFGTHGGGKRRCLHDVRVRNVVRYLVADTVDQLLSPGDSLDQFVH